MQKKIYIPFIIIIILLVIGFSFTRKGSTTDELISVPVKEGKFEITVMVTGELQAKNSEKITGPRELRNNRYLRFRDIKIQDLIPEGTVVDSGDYVATLDRSEANNQLKDIRDEVQKIESRYTKTKLDTTISLRNLRDELLNMKFAMEEAKIRLEQSKYEPPATIRQAEIELEKAGRAYGQAQRNYELKVQQAKADMTEVAIELAQQKRKRDAMLEVLEKFVITAPKKGMVIYHKEWSGQKRKVGSTINPWDLTVATLPDLSKLVSKTYVNEIDISKVKVGQQVEIGVDAFPGKKFTGIVSQVANIGEQLPNTDAKVFEVTISLKESDPVLRPSMTTSNIIHVKTFEDVLHIPLVAVFIEDSLTFVHMKNKNRQVVKLGEANENEIIVEHGLSIDDEILLNSPEKNKDEEWLGVDPLPPAAEKKN
jgi:multidrug efflux pump subunit AcrA (membrane-fusion protein)